MNIYSIVQLGAQKGSRIRKKSPARQDNDGHVRNDYERNKARIMNHHF
jgi:hypothetical protein